MTLERPIDAYASAVLWREGLRAQWGGDPLAEDPHRLASLAEFCGFAGLDPDALVAFCFLRKRATGERFVSVARRVEVAAKLRACCEKLELARARQLSADVLSFLIHNGVMMNPACARTTPADAAPAKAARQPV